MQKSAVYRHATVMCVTTSDEKKRHPVADDVLPLDSPCSGISPERSEYRPGVQLLL
ncbi:hypothetical protein PSP20601_00862 [Pandoraea sputorum]|nr:hypothetical protein PSP20601_00862 [Pandoraea sputorum]